LTSFSRSVVSDQCSTSAGRASVRRKLAWLIGEGVKLKPYRVVAEGVAGQPRPADRVFAFLDVLLGPTAAVVELDHPLGGERQVGDDEADARV
jgi:hypothetical protein